MTGFKAKILNKPVSELYSKSELRQLSYSHVLDFLCISKCIKHCLFDNSLVIELPFYAFDH